MKDYIPAIAAVVAGIFAILSAFIAWKLKSSSEETERSIAKERERRDELKRLYAEVFVMFEQAIKKVLNAEEFSLDRELSEVNAKVRLVASEPVIQQYHEVALLLTEWSRLHYRASPERMKLGDQSVTIFQAPDPTAQYKQPASEAHERLQDAIETLVQRMRSELASNA